MPGLNNILGLVSTLEKVERDMASGIYVKKAVEEHKVSIIDMNVSQLYDEGENSLGIKISTYQPYTPYTVELKKQKGQPVDRVTLRDTGDFHRSFYLTIEPTQFNISATDSKTEELISKYGENIFGLTEENKADLSHRFLLPVVLKQINSEVYGRS